MLKAAATPPARWSLFRSRCRRYRDGISKRRHTPGTGGSIGLLAVLTVLVVLTGAPSEGLAHGSDHPTALRNARNQFINLTPQKPVPAIPMLAATGGVSNLDRFRGKVVLLNFWATWCPPCIEELPALDRLQALLGNEAFAIVALSVDEGGIEVPVSFVNSLGLNNLSVYQDVAGRAQKALPVYGFPITYLIDRRSLVIGYIVGAAKWDSPESVRFLKHYIAQEIPG